MNNPGCKLQSQFPRMWDYKEKHKKLLCVNSHACPVRIVWRPIWGQPGGSVWGHERGHGRGGYTGGLEGGHILYIIHLTFLLLSQPKHYLYINLACLSVCLYPINGQTAEPIGPKFFVGYHMTTGKVYE